MKALSVRPPWAQAILHLGKDVENRSWRPPASLVLPFTIAVHSSKTLDFASRDEAAAALFRIVDLGPHDRAGAVRAAVARAANELGGLVGEVDVVGFAKQSLSPWAVEGAWHWLLANPRPRSFVPMKGARGLFDVERPTRGTWAAPSSPRPRPAFSAQHVWKDDE